jgi:hypothetical protein
MKMLPPEVSTSSCHHGLERLLIASQTGAVVALAPRRNLSKVVRDPVERRAPDRQQQQCHSSQR